MLSGVSWADQAAGLQDQIAQLVTTYEGGSGAVAGVSVRRCDGGDKIVSVKDDELFTPASNQKILTSAFALAELGGDYQFETRIYAQGNDVIIVGDFDPTLGDPVLAESSGRGIYADVDEWAAAIKRHFGDREVDTIILAAWGDTTSWRHPNWPTNQRRRTYVAPVSTLNFANNCLAATFVRTGQVIQPTLIPASRYIRVINNLAVGTEQAWSLVPSDDLSTVTLRGRIATSSNERIGTAIDNPPMLLGRVLAERLARIGVGCSGQFRTVEPMDDLISDATLLAQTRRPMQAAMWRMNKHSVNMVAEAILLRGGDGTWAGSRRTMGNILIQTYGLSPDSIRISDASGLSADNRVSPEAVTDVLSRILLRDDWAVFLNSLPLAGVEGRVQDRLTEPAYRGRVLAKTGFIRGVQCLSGYVLDSDNHPVFAYSVLVNRIPAAGDRAAKGLHDAVCRKLVDFVDREAQD